MNTGLRIALGIEYDGSAFHGWQTQADGVRTVQTVLTQAISKVADQALTLHCAGRTDTGVHALEQVVHFNTQAPRSLRAWVLGTNANLPPDVSVRWAREVPNSFHARFSATGRHYRYVILNQATRPALERERAVWIHRPLDIVRMQTAATDLLGTHDFSSYRALGCQAISPVRTLRYLQIERINERITLHVGADGFLHHMVRNIAGVLLAIGRGDQPVNWARELLVLRDRRAGGITAPPQGLYLARVEYAEFIGKHE